MINRVFADASFYVAILSPKDRFQETAHSLSADRSLRMVTSDFVLCEVANMVAEGGRQQFAAFLDQMEQDRFTRIVPASRALFNEGLALYRSRPDKAWSLTDCISFVLMKRHSLRNALTADHHFAQAGFTILMR